MNLYEEASVIVKKLSLEEKCKLCCGRSFWETFSIDELNIPSITLCDGPHGLRKEDTDKYLFINSKVIKSTCFPTATLLASTFDTKLINEMGKALGEECRQENVAVLLSPGINIKRLPICGRNFEYFSEDPYLSGKIGSALIKGIQSKGVGACLKHFAANNQEKYRMTIDSIIDERALREIYLKGFEIAIKESKPWCIMMAYNRVNGEYCCENKYLIQDILKKEWDYKGCIISDWGGVSSIIDSINNGLNIEMPGYNDDYYKVLQHAVKKGKIKEDILNESVTKVIELILKSKEGKKIPYKYNIQNHIKLAEEIAENGSVLLKNENNILPGNSKQNIAVIGKLAKEPSYQGLGSSEVNPNILDNAFQAFIDNNCNISYSEGYSLEKDDIDDKLLKEALKIVKKKDIVYLFVGLPQFYEGEGYDRNNINLPKSHINLIYEINKINKNLVVILQGGSVMDMSWDDVPRGILLTHLSGARGGNATVNLLLGKKNPSGKLSETYANYIEDYPSMGFYPGDKDYLEYRESIFVGYRYFNTVNKNIKYPFGYGLSYTNFQYSNMEVKYNNNNLEIKITITNIGDMVGKEVVQLYISCLDSQIFRPKEELKGFSKVELNPKESKVVTFTLNEDSFTYYNIETHQYEVEDGKYSINIGSSSRNIKYSTIINKRGSNIRVPNYKESAQSYYNINKLSPSKKEFQAIYGNSLPITTNQIYPFTINSTINDIKNIYGGDLIISFINKKAYRFAQGNKFMQITVKESLNDLPLRLLTMVTRGAISRKSIQGIVDLLNKHYIKGFLEILRNTKKF